MQIFLDGVEAIKKKVLICNFDVMLQFEMYNVQLIISRVENDHFMCN